MSRTVTVQFPLSGISHALPLVAKRLNFLTKNQNLQFIQQTTLRMSQQTLLSQHRKKTTPKAAMKQNRGSLLPRLFISNSGICIRQSADIRNLRSHHVTSFLYSRGFKPPPMILIFGPLQLCCKLYPPACKTHSAISFHLLAEVRFAFMKKQQQTSKDVRKGGKQRDQRPFSTCRCRVQTSVLLTPLPSNSK